MVGPHIVSDNFLRLTLKWAFFFLNYNIFYHLTEGSARQNKQWLHSFYLLYLWILDDWAIVEVVSENCSHTRTAQKSCCENCLLYCAKDKNMSWTHYIITDTCLMTSKELLPNAYPSFSSTNSCMDDLMDEDEKDRAKRYWRLCILGKHFMYSITHLLLFT